MRNFFCFAKNSPEPTYSHPDYEKRQYTMLPASGPHFRHGGQGVFLNFLVTDPLRGHPIGGCGVHRNLRIEMIMPHHA